MSVLRTLLLAVAFTWSTFCLAAGPIVGHYQLDGLVGGMLPDSAGPNDGTAAGPAFGAPVPGQIGNAMSFSGGQRFNLGADVLAGTSAFTVSAWVQPNSLAGTQHFLHSWDGPDPNFKWLMRISGGDFEGFARQVPPANSGPAEIPGGSLSTTDFNHIVLRLDGAQLESFLNATMTDSDAFTSATIGPGTDEAHIGANGSGANAFSGLLDDIGIWDSALSDGEIAAIFNLAEESALNYDAGEADQLFQHFGLGPGGGLLQIDGLGWQYTSGLAGNPGDVDPLGDGFSLVLEAGGLGLVALPPLTPEPGTALLFLAVCALLVPARFVYRRRVNRGL